VRAYMPDRRLRQVISVIFIAFYNVSVIFLKSAAALRHWYCRVLGRGRSVGGLPRPPPPTAHFGVSPMLTTTEGFDEAALNALIAAATVLGADLHAGLYVNVIAPSKRLVLAD